MQYYLGMNTIQVTNETNLISKTDLFIFQSNLSSITYRWY